MASVGVGDRKRMSGSAVSIGSRPPAYDEVIRSQASGTEQFELESSHTPGQACCRWTKSHTRVVKMIGLVYFSIGFFVTIPLCVTMAVIAMSDGIHSTVPEKIIPKSYYSDDSVDPAEQAAARCKAQPILPAFMVLTALGGFVITFALGVFHIPTHKVRKDCCDDGCNKAMKIIAIIVLVLFLVIYLVGNILTYQMWLEQKCDPFSTEGCPYSFCDNRLMQFVYIFYPSTMVLLTPFWVFCMYFAVVFVKGIVKRETDDS